MKLEDERVNFRQVKTCKDCLHSEAIDDYGHGPDFYCNIDKSKVPPTRYQAYEAHTLKELKGDFHRTKSAKVEKIFDEWAKDRQVYNNTCDSIKTLQ